MKTAVIWSRVSSKEQEQGYSPQAQVDICRSYAERQGFNVVREWRVAESAKMSGIRAHFDELIDFLSPDKAPRILLVEKTDRLSRNEEDFFAFKRLVRRGLEIHRVKEGVFSAKSSPGEWLLFKQMMVFAEFHNVDLSDKVKKGLDAKAQRGIYPWKPPMGYRLVNRMLVIDEVMAPIVRFAFEQYATGGCSLMTLARLVSERGMRSRFGRPMTHSALHTLLKFPVYYGEFDWRGGRIKGNHEPIISRELFERVAEQLRRVKGKPHEEPRKVVGYQRHFHTFAGLMTCSHCGNAIVGDLQRGQSGKGRYIYYRCRNRCEKPVREENLTHQFAAELMKLNFSEATLEQVAARIRASHADEEKFHRERIERLTEARERIDQQLHRLLDIHVDGQLTREQYEAEVQKRRQEQDRLDAQLAAQKAADRNYADTAVQLFQLARRAQNLFVAGTTVEKRKILRLICSNPTILSGQLKTKFSEPFDSLARTIEEEKQNPLPGEANSGLHPAWLGD